MVLMLVEVFLPSSFGVEEEGWGEGEEGEEEEEEGARTSLHF